MWKRLAWQSENPVYHFDPVVFNLRSRKAISVFHALATRPQEACYWNDELHQTSGLLLTTRHCSGWSLYFFGSKVGLSPSHHSAALNECDKTGRVSTESECGCINEKREALAINLPMVQCSPFHPWWHSHLPSLQVPCFTHRGLHTRWSHASPVQPSSQRHEPPIHTPCVPQSTEHTSAHTYKRHIRKQFSARYQIMSCSFVYAVSKAVITSLNVYKWNIKSCFQNYFEGSIQLNISKM